MARRSGAEWRGGQCIFSQGWRGVARRSLVPPGGRGDQNPAHPPPPIHLFGQLPHLRGGVGGGISGATPKNTLDGRPPPLEVGGDKIRRHPTPKYTFLNDPPPPGGRGDRIPAPPPTQNTFFGRPPTPAGTGDLRATPRHSEPPSCSPWGDRTLARSSGLILACVVRSWRGHVLSPLGG